MFDWLLYKLKPGLVVGRTIISTGGIIDARDPHFMFYKVQQGVN